MSVLGRDNSPQKPSVQSGGRASDFSDLEFRSADSQQGRGISCEAEVKFARGIHARPSALLKNCADRFPNAAVIIEYGGERALCSDLMGIMMLAVPGGSKVILTAVGLEKAAAIRAIAAILENGKFDQD